jgi:hypothetical protein
MTSTREKREDNKVSLGLVIFVFAVIIIVAAAVIWYFWDRSTLPQRMAEQGCTVDTYNQWGEPYAWDCLVP